MKIGITDPGGGLRGVYTDGIFDYCLEHKITFDLGIGVSAGAANLMSFLSGQIGRNYRFYAECPKRKEYIGLYSIVNQKSILNLDYIYNDLSNSQGEDPFNYEAYEKNPMDLLVVATDALHGMPKYFTRADISKDKYDALIASASIPIASPPVAIGDSFYYDGAVSDPIPVQKAFDEGCDKVIVLLTLPIDYRRNPKSDVKYARALEHKFPNMAHALRRRASLYNRSVALAKKYEAEGKVLIVAPDDVLGVHGLSKDLHAIGDLYHKGYHDAQKIEEFLR